LPLFGLANTTQQLPADLADSVLPRRELLQQIDRLRRQNEQFQSKPSKLPPSRAKRPAPLVARLAAAGALETQAR